MYGGTCGPSCQKSKGCWGVLGSGIGWQASWRSTATRRTHAMVDLLLARGGLANGAQAVRNNVTRPQPCDLRSVAPRSPRNSDAPDRAVRSYHYLHAHAQRGTPPIWSTPRSTWPRFGKASSGGIRRSRPPHIISVGSLSFGDPAGIGAEIRLSKSLAQRSAISRARSCRRCAPSETGGDHGLDDLWRERLYRRVDCA